MNVNFTPFKEGEPFDPSQFNQNVIAFCNAYNYLNGNQFKSLPVERITNALSNYGGTVGSLVFGKDGTLNGQLVNDLIRQISETHKLDYTPFGIFRSENYVHPTDISTRDVLADMAHPNEDRGDLTDARPGDTFGNKIEIARWSSPADHTWSKSVFHLDVQWEVNGGIASLAGGAPYYPIWFRGSPYQVSRKGVMVIPTGAIPPYPDGGGLITDWYLPYNHGGVLVPPIDIKIAHAYRFENDDRDIVVYADWWFDPAVGHHWYFPSPAAILPHGYFEAQTTLTAFFF